MLLISLSTGIYILCAQLADSFVDFAGGPIESMIIRKGASAPVADVLRVGTVSESEGSELQILEICWWQAFSQQTLPEFAGIGR